MEKCNSTGIHRHIATSEKRPDSVKAGQRRDIKVELKVFFPFETTPSACPESNTPEEFPARFRFFTF